MKKLTLLVSIFVIIVMLAITMPVAADRNAPVGERLPLWSYMPTLSAGEPFHIRHGWIQPSTDDAIGVFDFALDVDGAPQRESFKWFYAESGDPDMLTRVWVYNFPAGMTGTHTFTGHWFAPCKYAVDSLGYSGTCATPNEKVETATRTLTVTFVP